MTYRLIVIASLALTLAWPAAGVSEPVNPDDYPSLDAKQIGHLRQFLKLSRQLPNDWSEMLDEVHAAPEGTPRYQLAFGLYATASAQFNVTPAYRDLYEEIIDSFVTKLRHPTIWRDWASVSRGGGDMDPEIKEDLGYGWIDPVKKHNVMYSGHLFQAAALHEALYRTGKYMEPGSLTLSWVDNNWGPGPQEFEYSLPKLAENLYQQFVDNDFAGIPCEPNVIYPECPQHAVLGLKLYDTLAGTKYADDVAPRFLEQFDERGYLNEETGAFVMLFRRRQQTPLVMPMAFTDGWTGTFMHAWAPEYIQALYPRQRDLYLDSRFEMAVQTVGDKMSSIVGNNELGFLAMLASEVGDTETVDAILEFADQNYGPVWRDGRYYYPRKDWSEDRTENESLPNSALTGNALFAFARLNRQGGMHDLHNKTWSADHWAQPYIAEVDLAAASVSQAIYDAEKNALVVGLLPGPLDIVSTTFELRNMDPESSWRVYRGGEYVGSLSAGQVIEGLGIDWPDGTTVNVTVDPRAPVQLVFQRDGRT